MIKTVHFDSLKSGPHIVILGAVHGDEKCGTQAIERFIRDVEAGNISILCGRVTFVPVCNPKAFELNKRFVDRNLNRSLYVKQNPQNYEDYIDPILCDILSKADILLDLHSYASQGDEFAFMGAGSQTEIDYSLSLGVSDFIYGWSDAFGKTDLDPKISMGTTEFTRANGGIAITVECGNHHNIQASNVGYRTICYAMQHFNMINSVFAPIDIKDQKYNFVKMQDVFLKERKGDFVKKWKHYDRVKSGDIIAVYHDDTTIIAPYDGVMVLPKPFAEIAKEWFYLGQEINFPVVNGS